MHSGALSEKVLLDLCCHLSKSLPAFLYFRDFPSLLDSPGRAEYWRFDLSDELSRTHRDYSILLFPLSTQWAEIQKKVLAQLFVDASLFASILFYIFKKKCSKGEQKVKVKIVSINYIFYPLFWPTMSSISPCFLPSIFIDFHSHCDIMTKRTQKSKTSSLTSHIYEADFRK